MLARARRRAFGHLTVKASAGAAPPAEDPGTAYASQDNAEPEVEPGLMQFFIGDPDDDELSAADDDELSFPPDDDGGHDHGAPGTAYAFPDTDDELLFGFAALPPAFAGALAERGAAPGPSPLCGDGAADLTEEERSRAPQLLSPRPSAATATRASPWRSAATLRCCSFRPSAAKATRTSPRRSAASLRRRSLAAAGPPWRRRAPARGAAPPLDAAAASRPLP